MLLYHPIRMNEYRRHPSVSVSFFFLFSLLHSRFSTSSVYLDHSRYFFVRPIVILSFCLSFYSPAIFCFIFSNSLTGTPFLLHAAIPGTAVHCPSRTFSFPLHFLFRSLNLTFLFYQPLPLRLSLPPPTFPCPVISSQPPSS